MTQAQRVMKSLEALHPELVPELATERDFTVWHKSLA